MSLSRIFKILKICSLNSITLYYQYEPCYNRALLDQKHRHLSQRMSHYWHWHMV